MLDSFVEMSHYQLCDLRFHWLNNWILASIVDVLILPPTRIVPRSSTEGSSLASGLVLGLFLGPSRSLGFGLHPPNSLLNSPLCTNLMINDFQFSCIHVGHANGLVWQRDFFRFLGIQEVTILHSLAHPLE